MPDQNENSMVNEKVPSVYIIFLFLLISLTSTAQNNDTTFQGSIIAGTSQWFIISAANHPTVKAKILSIDGDFISVKDRGGSITKIEIKTIKSIEKVPYGKLGTFGLGFGLPYGILGLNVEINVTILFYLINDLLADLILRFKLIFEMKCFSLYNTIKR